MGMQTANAHVIEFGNTTGTAAEKKQRISAEKARFFKIKDRREELDRVTVVPVELIESRQKVSYSRAGLAELAESIKEYGVLQPISIRSIEGHKYELIAGARRLQAAKSAGLTVIPAMIYDINKNDSAVMSLLENLQREDLHFIEEAEAYYCLMMEHGITQDDLAYRLGKSQSTIANKIRLLKLPPLVKRIISDNGLSERHARALLKISDEQLQLRTLRTVCGKRLNVSKTEQLVSKILEKKLSGSKEEEYAAIETELANDSYQIMICEIKSFINDLRKNVDGLKRAGVVVKAAQFDREDYFEFIVRIPKAENGMKRRE